jgi:hypothetical protein
VAHEISYGPISGTAIGSVVPYDLTITPNDFDADLSVVEEGPGKVIYTDTKAYVDRPETVRIAQQSRPNVYSGTTIDPASALSYKRGTDTIVELKGVGAIVDGSDADYVKYFPYRLAVTMTLPTHVLVDSTFVITQLQRLLSYFCASNSTDVEGSFAAGIDGLLRGVVKKA